MKLGTVNICPGCVGRGIGANCAMCGNPIPAGKRRTKDSPSEVRKDCENCVRGFPHSHNIQNAKMN